MPLYAFVVRNRLGRSEKGVLEAANPEEAVSILQARELIVVSVKEHKSEPATLGRGQRFHRGARAQDLVTFARSLAAMTDAGLPLIRSMEAVQAQTRSRALSNAIAAMVHDIRGGSTFRDAMAKHPTVFSSFWISLIETGEASGQLTRALEQIGTHLEKAGSVQRKVISALIYPSILILVAVGAILIFTLKVVPTFETLYKGLDTGTGGKKQLPGLTMVIIAFSNFMRKFFPILVFGAIAIWLFLLWYTHTERGRWQFDKLKLRLPIIGPLFQGMAAEQFASNLGTLLKAGVPILHALEIVITTCPNKVIASVLEHMRAGVREGRSLVEPLNRTDVFPPMVAQMVSVGEQTGKLSSMLEEVARYYEEQVSTTVDRMTNLLEPAMIIGMGLVIGTLIISMYLPIFSLGQMFGG